VTWLATRPAWLLVAGCVGLAWLLAAASRWLILRAVPTDDHDQIPSIAGPLMPALGAAFALLMGLTLANEATYLRSAQDIASNEAAQASRLAWAATSPHVRSEPVHDALGDYLRATRADEWHDISSAERADPATAQALAELERVTRREAAREELGTPDSTELLTSLDGVSSARRARLASAARPLPVLYILTLAASGVALLVNAGALTFRSGLRTSVLLLGLATVIGLSMALLFALTAPWDGPLVVSQTPIDEVVRDLDDGFFTP
jgi:hypothetical protein